MSENESLKEINNQRIAINDLINSINKFNKNPDVFINDLENFSKLRQNFKFSKINLIKSLNNEIQLVDKHLSSNISQQSDQNVLLSNRPVAFKLPKNSDDDPDDLSPLSDNLSGEDQWILAKIVNCLNIDKSIYNVQDVEPAEDGGPGQTWKTTLRSIIPLPFPNAPTPQQQSFPPDDYQINTLVLGLYPDTTSFYRAIVVQTPDKINNPNAYLLRFEDDDAPFQTVQREYVVKLPKDFI